MKLIINSRFQRLSPMKNEKISKKEAEEEEEKEEEEEEEEEKVMVDPMTITADILYTLYLNYSI